MTTADWQRDALMRRTKPNLVDLLREAFPVYARRRREALLQNSKAVLVDLLQGEHERPPAPPAPPAAAFVPEPITPASELAVNALCVAMHRDRDPLVAELQSRNTALQDRIDQLQVDVEHMATGYGAIGPMLLDIARNRDGYVPNAEWEAYVLQRTTPIREVWQRAQHMIWDADVVFQGRPPVFAPAIIRNFASEARNVTPILSRPLP
jgi:hypothetical protein